MVGAEVYNDGLVYQIDGQNANFLLKQKGTGTCNTSQSTGGRTRYYTLISITSSFAPIMAIGNTSHGVCTYAISISGSTWTFMIVSNTNGATFDYYVFDNNVVPTGTVGFEVYDDFGVLMFKSGGKPLRIEDEGPGTYTSGRTYACFQTSNGFTFTAEDFAGTGDINYTSLLGSFTASGNVVAEAPFAYENYTYTGTPEFYDTYTDPNYKLIVVDVTNY